MELDSLIIEQIEKSVKKRIRKTIREETEDILLERKEELMKLKDVIEPNRLKTSLKSVINNTIKQSLDFELEDRINKYFNKLVKKVDIIVEEKVREELDKINIIETISNLLDKKTANNFKPIIKNAISMCNFHITQRINKKIKDIVNLKTSTLQEISFLTNQTSQTEKSYLKKQDQELDYFDGDKRYLEFFNKQDKEKDYCKCGNRKYPSEDICEMCKEIKEVG